MSGGSFDYAYTRVEQFTDALKDMIQENPEGFKPVVMAKLREIAMLTEYTAKFMKETEWLYSGDTGDDSFMENVREIENPGKSWLLCYACPDGNEWGPDGPTGRECQVCHGTGIKQ